MINRGVKLQLNIGSLTNAYGPVVRTRAEQLVDQGVIDFVGSDCHHMKHIEMIDYARRLPKFHKLIQQKQILNSTL